VGAYLFIKMETYYQRNKQKCLERTREYKRTHKDKVKEWSKKYCEKNKAAISIRARERRLANIEKYKERERRAGKKNPIIRKRAQLKRDYNITLDDYNNMLMAQNNSCAICGMPQNKLKKNLCIDHNHKTGEIRALLCHSCNLILGNCFESISVLERAIEYLNKYQ
jgi:hypothetical protein